MITTDNFHERRSIAGNFRDKTEAYEEGALVELRRRRSNEIQATGSLHLGIRARVLAARRSGKVIS